MPITFSNKPGLVAYLTCGDPSLEISEEIVVGLIDSGADVIELGVPFSDPVADGPVIQRASERALANGVTLSDVLQLARRVHAKRSAGLVIFSYYNPIVRFGLERFCEEAAAAGVSGAIVTDVPVEEAGPYVEAMRKHSLDPIFLAAPTSTDERLKAIADLSSGFVYAVSRTGVTGTRQEVAGDAKDLVSRLRKFTKLPIAVGFGVSNANQFAEVGAFADAAVVGSAIVQTIERSPKDAPKAVADFVRGLRAKNSVAGVR